MEVFKVTKNADYTVLDNGFLKRGDISLKAIGLLSKILSLPPNWNFSVKGIAVTCKESEKAIRGILKELQLLGYHHYSKISKNGTFVYQYDFYENPNLNSHYQKTDVHFAHVQKVKVLKVDVPKVDIQKGDDNKINKESNTQQIKYSTINIIPDFSENCTDLSANADASSNFEVNTISSFSNSENLNQELTLLKSQNSNLKQKESGRFSGELIEIKQVKPDYPDLFERLWTGYRAVAKDKAGGKQEAFKAWQKVKNKANPQDFEKAIAAYSLSKRVKEGFILNFSTFLNSGRWETELENGSESMEEEKRRANGRALKAQAEAQLEEEYRTGARWRP
jgi:hypothetical protein